LYYVQAHRDLSVYRGIETLYHVTASLNETKLDTKKKRLKRMIGTKSGSCWLEQAFYMLRKVWSIKTRKMDKRQEKVTLCYSKEEARWRNTSKE